MKQRNIRKLAAIFMLVSFIFSTVSPALAGNGIVKGWKGAFNGGTAIGEEADFLGTSWKLYKVDDTADASGNKYAYVITKGSIGSSAFYTSDSAEPVKDDKANQYATSTIRGVVSTNPDSCENKMIGYDPADPTTWFPYYTATGRSAELTWEQINGGADRAEGSKEYIAKHYMPGEETKEKFTDAPATPGYITESVDTDKLYLLSKDEANEMPFEIRNNGGLWWLRSPVMERSFISHSVGYSSIGSVEVTNVGYRIRPALQINLKSELFDSMLFKTAEGGKDAAAIGRGFSLPEVDDPAALTKQTVEALTFTDDTAVSANYSLADVTEAIEQRIGTDKVIDLTRPLLTGKQLQVTYSGFGTNEAQDHVAAVVSTGSGDSETYVNYAKLSTNTSGTDLIVDTSKLANGEYNLYLFAEKIDGTHERIDDASTPVADAATNLVSAGSSFILDNTYTNEGTLDSAYNNSGLTANLGGDFNLSFEAGEYDTAVTVGDGETGTITAHGSGGCSSTLKGNITVGEGAKLTTVNGFRFRGADCKIDGTLTGDALEIEQGKTTVSSTGSIENELTVSRSGILEAYATGLKNNVTNNATVNLTGGTLDKKITGTGTTEIAGDVTANTKIETAITVDESKKLTASADNLGGDVTNHGTVDLTGGNLVKAVTGGNLNVNGDVTSKADYIAGDTNTVAADKTLTLNAGTLGKAISGDGTVKITGDVTANADYVAAATNKVDENATLTLNAGTLAKAISGEGMTKITGDVTANADIATALTVDTLGGLTALADNLKNDVTNSGIVNFTGGTLAKNYTSTGTTNFKGKTKFSDKVTLTNSTVNFYLDGFKAGETIVTSDKAAVLGGAEIGLYQITDTDHKLTKDGDKITLISKVEGYDYTEDDPNFIDVQGGMVEDTYGVYQSETGALEAAYLESGIIDETKSFSEARLAGSAALNSASDLVAGQAIDNAASGDSWQAFAAMGGSHGRYNTGSHVDLNSLNVAAGLSKKIKDNVTLGLFVEGGNGRYTTYNEFEEGDVRADGDINYFGGGIFAKVEGKKTAKGQLHGEASFRAGHMNSDYNSETFDEDMLIRFDTSNAYLGMHAGIGYKWNVKDGSNVDTYVKYLWNRQNSDSPTIAEKKFDLDAINSHRLRAGFRYNSKENNKGIKFFGGLAYEYEFDGVAKGRMGEYAILEPDYKGGSGIAEIGFKYDKANNPWKVELGVTGATGKRDSIGISLGAMYEFGK